MSSSEIKDGIKEWSQKKLHRTGKRLTSVALEYVYAKPSTLTSSYSNFTIIWRFSRLLWEEFRERIPMGPSSSAAISDDAVSDSRTRVPRVRDGLNTIGLLSRQRDVTSVGVAFLHTNYYAPSTGPDLWHQRHSTVQSRLQGDSGVDKMFGHQARVTVAR
jgi:hypothetical protein